MRAKRSNPGTELTGKYSKTEISQTRLLRRYAPRNDEGRYLNRHVISVPINIGRFVLSLIIANTNGLSSHIVATGPLSAGLLSASIATNVAAPATCRVHLFELRHDADGVYAELEQILEKHTL